MKRILFWILVAIFVGVFFFVVSHPESLTANQSTVLWTSIVTVGVVVVSLIIICSFAYAIFDMLKKGVAPVPIKYCNMVYSRDSQPLVYWTLVLFWVVLFFFYYG
jgi:hypothetical protein